MEYEVTTLQAWTMGLRYEVKEGGRGGGESEVKGTRFDGSVRYSVKNFRLRRASLYKRSRKESPARDSESESDSRS